MGLLGAWFPRKGNAGGLGTPGPTLVLLLTLLIPESGPDFVLPPALSSAPSDLLNSALGLLGHAEYLSWTLSPGSLI